MAKPVKAKEQIRLSTGDVMTLGEALDRGLVTLGTTEERAARPRGERLTVRSYYAKDPRTQDLWPVSRALFESRTAGTFKPGSSAPTKVTSKAREPVAASTETPFMVLSDGDVIGYYADLPSATTAADHWQEEYDRRVKIFDGDRVVSKGEIETARKAHATKKKSPAQLQREIDKVLARAPKKVAGFAMPAARQPGYQIVSVPILKGPRSIGPSGLDSPRERNESVVFATRAEAEAYLPSVKRFAADFGRDAVIKEVW